MYTHPRVQKCYCTNTWCWYISSRPDWVPLNPIKWDINSFCMLLPRLAHIFGVIFHHRDLHHVSIMIFVMYPSMMDSIMIIAIVILIIIFIMIHHVSITIYSPMANFMVPVRPGRQISRSSSATINTELRHNYHHHHRHHRHRRHCRSTYHHHFLPWNKCIWYIVLWESCFTGSDDLIWDNGQRGKLNPPPALAVIALNRGAVIYGDPIQPDK